MEDADERALDAAADREGRSFDAEEKHELSCKAGDMLTILKEEIERAMRLMGVTSVDQLNPDRLRYRQG